MAVVDDTTIAVADVYAAALLVITEQKRTSTEVRDQLAELAAYIEKDLALADFLASPVVNTDARAHVIERAFRGRLDDTLVDGLQVLNQKGRTGIIPTLYARYRLKLEQIRGEVDVYVTSATPLNDKLRSRIVDVLRRYTGKKPELIERVDAGILGGLSVRIEDEKIDSTVARRLEVLRQALLERASREIHTGQQYFEGAVT
jgi:F-type H+-transporting ATPase subunit delta